MGDISYLGGLKGWCAANGIAYSTVRQARDLCTHLTEDQVRGLTITEALKLSGQIKDRTEERSAKTKAATVTAEETNADANKEADKVLESSNGHASGNGKPTNTVSSSTGSANTEAAEGSLTTAVIGTPVPASTVHSGDGSAIILVSRNAVPDGQGLPFYLRAIRDQLDLIEASSVPPLREVEILGGLVQGLRQLVECHNTPTLYLPTAIRCGDYKQQYFFD